MDAEIRGDLHAPYPKNKVNMTHFLLEDQNSWKEYQAGNGVDCRVG